MPDCKQLVMFLALYTPAGILVAAAMPDFAREKRLAGEFVDTIVVGDLLQLNDGQRDFAAIMTGAEPQPSRGAVMILHGRGHHPAWPTVVQPLRTTLPDNGWGTLSLQLPVLGKDAKYYDYVPIFPAAHGRIAAGLRYLREAGYRRVVILAHSCGAHMAMSFVRTHGDNDFDAYIGIGMGATDYRQPMKRPLPLAQISKPVLDIYGANDFPAVLRLAPQRRAMIEQAGNASSRQVVIKAADHHYQQDGNTEALTGEILQWLQGL